MERATDIVIAGAGPAGLAVAACLARRGLRARVLERGAAPGWSWAQHYASLRLHTSRGISGLPGLRLRSATPYPDREELARYCADYAKAFSLDVELHTEVTSLRRDGERWRVGTSRGDCFARHVVVATGFFGGPRLPDWPGIEQFRGRWLSPRDLDEGVAAGAGSVLVVGLGNTGADMIAELGRRGARVCVSVRSPVHVVPLEVLGVNAFRWARWLPERAGAAARLLGAGAAERVEQLSALLWARIQESSFGDLRALGLELESPAGILRDQRNGLPPVIGGSWVGMLRRGELSVRRGIARLTADGAEFVDGIREPFDAILPAIGLEESRFALAGLCPVPLRDGAVEGAPGLWLCGTAPALRHIRRAAPRVAASIAAAMTPRDGPSPASATTP